MDDTVHLYDEEYAATFEEEILHTGRIRRLLPLFQISQDDKVADFGCGIGALAEHVAPLVRQYVGVDFSEVQIRHARRRAQEMGLENVIFEAMPITEFCRQNPQTFDTAFSLDVSEHVADDAWLEILEEIHSSLIDGGTLYLHTPNAGFIVEIMKSHNFILKQFPHHIAVRNSDQNAKLLQSAGFSHVAVSYLPHYNVFRFLHPLSRLPLLGAFFRARLFITARK